MGQPTPAPHQTGRADFPHPAFREPSSQSYRCSLGKRASLSGGVVLRWEESPPSDAPTPKTAAQPRVPAEANLPTLTRRFQTWRASPARLAYQIQRLATLYLFACSGGVSLGNGGIDGGCRLGGKSPSDSEKREE